MGAELDSLEVYIQRNLDEQMLNRESADVFIGPAAVSAPNSFQGPTATTLTPSLLGTLAEGIVALGGLEEPTSETPTSLRIDFNCHEESKDSQVVAVDIPVTGRTNPLHLTFNKQCNVSATRSI